MYHAIYHCVSVRVWLLLMHKTMTLQRTQLEMPPTPSWSFTDFLEKHHVPLRMKILVFGICSTLFDNGSDLYNGLLYLWPKNVTRTMPEGFIVPPECIPNTDSVGNSTYTCVEVDIFWGVGSLSLLQLPATMTGFCLLVVILLDNKLSQKKHLLMAIIAFIIVPFPITVLGVQLFLFARPNYDGLVNWKSVSNSVLVLEAYGEAGGQAALQVRLSVSNITQS